MIDAKEFFKKNPPTNYGTAKRPRGAAKTGFEKMALGRPVSLLELAAMSAFLSGRDNPTTKFLFDSIHN